jgi:hypothetical protein
MKPSLPVRLAMRPLNPLWLCEQVSFLTQQENYATFRVLRILLTILICLFFCIPIQANPLPARQWTDDAKLWTARSCAGESGFEAVEECAAIAWVYANRSAHYRCKYTYLVRRYSSAVKKHERHRRPWLFELDLQGTRPKTWPSNLDWSKHKKLWFRLLKMLDHWAAGQVVNPVPGADHFGGKMDLPGKYWRIVKPKTDAVFKNIFYQSKG